MLNLRFFTKGNGKSHYRILSNPGDKSAKNKYPPLKINPFMMSFLEEDDRQVLEAYIQIINCNQIGLNVLGQEDLERFKDLVFQLNLIEVGLL